MFYYVIIYLLFAIITALFIRSKNFFPFIHQKTIPLTLLFAVINFFFFFLFGFSLRSLDVEWDENLIFKEDKINVLTN